jgi:galactokinase
VNLIGEHVDYNGGFVLPIAMSQALYVVVSPSDDDTIEVHTTVSGESVRFPANCPGPPGKLAWANYVRGVAEMLRREGIQLAPGRLLIHSEVPLGGGVSSSAALEVGTALALLALAGHTLEPVRLALLARRAEHEYANSPCGIMDQFICVLGKQHHALMLDCRSQTYEHLLMQLDDVALAVMNTQIKHNIGASEYPVRQQQCQDGLAILKAIYPQVRTLRDATFAQLTACRDKMDPITFQRCRHVVSEIEHTQQAAEALRRGDPETFGRLMVASHISLRDDYAVSCAELDALVDIATGIPSVYGARMTGGGFGGCAIALIRASAEEPLRAEVRDQYDARFQEPAIVYTTTASDGAGVHVL